MKQDPIESQEYIVLIKEFGSWLLALGYSAQNVYHMPLSVRELLHFLEEQELYSITALNEEHLAAHYGQVSIRTSARGGALRVNTLKRHRFAIRMFTDYLRVSGLHTVIEPHWPLEQEESFMPVVLSTEEIAALYEATYEDPDLGIRDRAMLGIYYGCGLRRSEGVKLDIEDVLVDKMLLRVRQGKNYRDRFVPVSAQGMKHLKEYINQSRAQQDPEGKHEALFLSERGKRLGGQGFYLRLKLLAERSGMKSLENKQINLHSLRHSVATHLLEAGMKLEQIAQFLGHRSLESTQLYTHLQEKNSRDKKTKHGNEL